MEGLRALGSLLQSFDTNLDKASAIMKISAAAEAQSAAIADTLAIVRRAELEQKKLTRAKADQDAARLSRFRRGPGAVVAAKFGQRVLGEGNFDGVPRQHGLGVSLNACSEEDISATMRCISAEATYSRFSSALQEMWNSAHTTHYTKDASPISTDVPKKVCLEAGTCMCCP